MGNNDIFDVSGLVTVITGGASGIGLAVAEVLSAGGASVTLVDRDADALAGAERDLSAGGAEVDIIEADVTETGALSHAFDAVAAKHGRIDVVFANAGIGGGPGFLTGDGARNSSRNFEDLPDAQWDQVMAVNLTGAFHTVQTAARIMKPKGAGKIIVTSSISAFKAEQFVGTPYVVSKAGVAQIVRQAALELAGYGITVNAMAPGPFITNISGGRLKDADARAVFERNIPLRRMGEPGDIKGLALFLASGASDYMTGAHMVIDGGFSLGFAD
ncbi:MAG: SDR family oxidoreductase [Rhodospirillaceae bacterium]|nr:SDR family oxidoreductase [Rhodospirillaceae bacterium]